MKNANAPTAAIIVRDFDGIAVHTLLNIQRLFPNHFHNIVFVSVGVIDTGQFKGHAEIENLRRKKEEDLKSFVDFATCLGWYAEYRCGFGVDLIAELEELCEAVAKEFPRSVFFSGTLVFQEENAVYPHAAQSHAVYLAAATTVRRPRYDDLADSGSDE